MKKSFILLATFTLFSCVACNLLTDVQSDSKLTFKATTSSKTSQKDTVLFTGSAIKSFNDSTGEVTLSDTLTPKKLNSFHWIKCYLGTDSLFTATLTSDIMSSLVNDLVLNHNLHDGKYYFEDGYPDWIDNLGATNLRAQNKQKRADTWAKFIAQLKLEGKYKK